MRKHDFWFVFHIYRVNYRCKQQSKLAKLFTTILIPAQGEYTDVNM